MTREELATMTDQELLAYEREHHDDPDMTLEKATESQRLALHFWASGGRQQEGAPGGPGGVLGPAVRTDGILSDR